MNLGSEIGDENLKLIDQQNNFCNWLYSEIKPFLKGKILEVGSGIGTYSKRITNDFKESQIFLTDSNEAYVHQLKNEFSNKAAKCFKLDLNKKEDFLTINQKVDSVLALNVLEHIRDDVDALNNLYNILKPNGRLVLLVPAHKFLFNSIDRAIGHYRRYEKEEIKDKISKTQFKIKDIFYFNALGILGWWINGSLFKRSAINRVAINLFNKIVPWLKFIEKKIFLGKIGISLIIILEK